VLSRADVLREAAELLDNAGAARRRGDRSLAGRLFLSAAALVGPEAVEEVAPLFQEGAPPLVTTPPKHVEAPAPQPAAVGQSEVDAPPKRPERGTLKGQLELEGHADGVLAVVTLEPLGARVRRPPPQQRAMAQRGQQFTPRLMVVPVGSTVAFPNLDPIYHNVFSRSEIDPFDLGLFKEGFAREKTFEKPGVYRLGCNIHSTMSAYVVVVGEPHYTVVEGGTFRFDRLAPGAYRLKAWTETSAEPVEQQLMLKPGPNTVTVRVTGVAPPRATDKFGTPR
jgi:plastocyanin